MNETPDGAAHPIAVLVDREGLGDALLKLPFLRAVRRGFPGRPVWWIATHQTSMAGELRPFVGGLIDRVIDHAGLTGKSREVRERLRHLPRFDLVFDSRTHVASVLLARTVLERNFYFVCLPGYVLSDRRPLSRRTRPRGIAARMLSLAEAALGRAPDWQGTLAVSDAAAALAAERLPDGPRYVGLAIGSREPRKNWPLDRFAELSRAIVAQGAVPAFFTGPQERDRLDALRALAPPAALFPQAEPPDPASGVGELELAVALCRRLAAAVANDSGIGHLIAAVGTPLVSLFGPTDAARWAPFTERGAIVRAQDYGGSAMEAIPLDAVARAVERLLRV